VSGGEEKAVKKLASAVLSLCLLLALLPDARAAVQGDLSA
jgi:hypothetical protein